MHGEEKKEKLAKGQIKFVFMIVIIVSVFAILVGIPLLIHYFYSIPAPAEFMETSWNEADYLSFFGSALGGIGTITLGIVTFIQTKILKDESVDRENANIKRPFFTIQDIICGCGKWERSNHGHILRFKTNSWSFIKVSNIGDGVANNLVIEPWGNEDTPKNDIPCFSTLQNEYITIPVMIQAVEETQYITIYYQNIIGYAYSQRIDIVTTNSLNYKGILLSKEGKNNQAKEEEYIAAIYNIYPQQPLGMGKYKEATGKYIV